MSLHHMMEQDLSIFVHPILTLSPLALFATTILAARSNISTTLKPVRAEHSAKLAALISFCTSITSLYLKKEALNTVILNRRFSKLSKLAVKK